MAEIETHRYTKAYLRPEGISSSRVVAMGILFLNRNRPMPLRSDYIYKFSKKNFPKD